MANQLKMATIQTILSLRAQHWSFRRIAETLGVHRETVGPQVGEETGRLISERILGSHKTRDNIQAMLQGFHGVLQSDAYICYELIAEASCNQIQPAACWAHGRRKFEPLVVNGPHPQRVEESQKTLAVYKDRLLPTAGHSIEAARASYVAGNLDFLRLIESQRQLLMLQDRYYEAIAQYHQRVAELDRLVGAPATAMAGSAVSQ